MNQILEKIRRQGRVTVSHAERFLRLQVRPKHAHQFNRSPSQRRLGHLVALSWRDAVALHSRFRIELFPESGSAVQLLSDEMLRMEVLASLALSTPADLRAATKRLDALSQQEGTRDWAQNRIREVRHWYEERG